MVNRVENWQLYFSSYLEEKKHIVFEWGSHDCLRFVAGAVQSITNVNFFPPDIEYSNQEEANEILNSRGGIVNVISEALGTPHSNYRKAGRGDVVIFKNLNRLVTGVVDDGGKRIVTITSNGFGKFPLNNIEYIWSY